VGVVNDFVSRSSSFSCIECVLLVSANIDIKLTRSSGIRYPSNSHLIRSSTNFRLLAASCGFGRGDPGMASQLISLSAIPWTRECNEMFSCCFAVMSWRASSLSAAWNGTHVEVGL
jgi:hypothetical protein